MSAKQTIKQASAVCESERPVAMPYFVPVAIPDKRDQSRNIKADLEACDIPALLEIQEAEMDADKLGGIPVLVPEGSFELASEIVDMIELDAIDDEADFEEDEFEEFEDDDEEDEEEEEEEWDEDEYEDEDEDEEEEEEEEEGEEDAEEFDEDDEDEDDLDLDEEE
jgi:hypothetical protein